MTPRILQLQAEWLACQPLPQRNSAALWQWIRMRFNHLSNRFEGNTLTYSETQLLLIYGRAAGDHELREYEEMKATMRPLTTPATWPRMKGPSARRIYATSTGFA